jgi:glycosyltransferase involved in cell wall biosynthesis
VAEGAPKTLVWYWATGGAGVRFSQRVAQCIAETQGAENVALSLHEKNAWIERSRAGGHPVMTIGGASGHRAAARIALQAGERWLALRRQVDAFRPQVAVIPMNFALAWPYCRSFTRRGVPFIYVVHDAAPHPGDYMRLWQSRVQRLLIRNAARVVALSDHVARQIEASGVLRQGQRCDVIPLAAHDAATRRTPRQPPSGPLALLFLGRLLPYKGLSLLAEALAGLREHPGWRLTIAGDGPDKDRVRALFAGFPQVELKLELLEESGVDGLIRDHDVLVCPYLEASQSGVIAEALYQGMPCLVTPVGGLPEQIGFGAAGWVADAPTADAVARALRAAVEGGLVPCFSAAALDMVRTTSAALLWANLVESTVTVAPSDR